MRGEKMELQPPPELTKSLQEFTETHPDPTKIGFIMMRFRKENDPIIASIKSAFLAHRLKVMAASEHPFHPDLLPNVKTYMWGCGFGIAVYDRLAAEDFNPNVSFELGYMIALQKPVLIFLDTEIPTLFADIAAKLYEPFEPLSDLGSIPPAVERFVLARRLS
jgi:hypothetical protein